MRNGALGRRLARPLKAAAASPGARLPIAVLLPFGDAPKASPAARVVAADVALLAVSWRRLRRRLRQIAALVAA